jgi:hypothetical protein
MRVGSEETKSLKIKNPDLMMMTMKMVGAILSSVINL